MESWLSYTEIYHQMARVKHERAYSSDGERELAHWVESRRASVKQFLDEFGNRGTSSPVLGESSDLLLCGDLASNEEPKQSFGQRLRASGSFWEQFLAFGDGLATEANTLVCATSVLAQVANGVKQTSIENGAIPDESGEATHTTRQNR